MSKSVTSCVSYCVAGNACCGTTTAREAWKTVGSEWGSHSQGVKKFTCSRKLGTRSPNFLGFYFAPPSRHPCERNASGPRARLSSVESDLQGDPWHGSLRYPRGSTARCAGRDAMMAPPASTPRVCKHSNAPRCPSDPARGMQLGWAGAERSRRKLPHAGAVMVGHLGGPVATSPGDPTAWRTLRIDAPGQTMPRHTPGSAQGRWAPRRPEAAGP